MSVKKKGLLNGDKKGKRAFRRWVAMGGCFLLFGIGGVWVNSYVLQIISFGLLIPMVRYLGEYASNRKVIEQGITLDDQREKYNLLREEKPLKKEAPVKIKPVNHELDVINSKTKKRTK